MKRIRPRIAGLLLFAMVGLSSPPATAEDDVAKSLNEAMIKLSNEISQFIQAEADSQGQVAVGSFTGPANSGAGPRIVQALKENLKARCKIVDVGAAYTVSGKFMGQQIDGNFVTVIEAEIDDLLGNAVQTLRRKIVTELDEGLAFFGPSSVDLSASTKQKPHEKPTSKPIGKDPVTNGEKLVSSIVKPQTHLDIHRTTRMNLSSGSPYGMEILVKEPGGTYRPLSVTHESGLARVDIQTDQVYVVRLYNDSPRHVGCRLTIDGLNMFALSLDPRYQGKDVIMELAPQRSFQIKGWHHSGNISHEFRVTNYGDTPAAKFGVFEGVGMITATFYETYAATRSFKDATGVGEEIEMLYREGRSQFGKPIGAVSVRYLRPAHPTDLPTN